MAMALPCHNPIKNPSIASQLLPCQGCQTTVFPNLTVAQADDRGLMIHGRSPYLQRVFTTVPRKYCLKSFDDMWFFAFLLASSCLSRLHWANLSAQLAYSGGIWI
jgi:hypothetical protein